MTTRARDSTWQNWLTWFRVRLAGFAIFAIAISVVGISPNAGAATTFDEAQKVHFPAKLKVLRASIRDGALEALLSITGRATGTITVDYQAAGQFRRMFIAIGEPQDGEKRVGLSQPLSGRQRAARTGIINAAFAGDDATQSDSARLRAASGRSGLKLDRLTFADGQLSVAGSIDRRVSGIVRLRASYLDVDGSIGLWTGRSPVEMGTWALDEKLPAAAAFDPNAYLTMQFTGQKDAPGGPFRGGQIGKSLGNLDGMPVTPPIGTVDQAPVDPGDLCDGDIEDDCG